MDVLCYATDRYWLLDRQLGRTAVGRHTVALSVSLWDAIWVALVVGAVGAVILGRRGVLVQQSAKLVAGLCLFIALPLALRWFFSVSGLVNLPIVRTELWGGMLVTMVVATVGITCSFLSASCSRSAGGSRCRLRGG